MTGLFNITQVPKKVENSKIIKRLCAETLDLIRQCEITGGVGKQLPELAKLQRANR